MGSQVNIRTKLKQVKVEKAKSVKSNNVSNLKTVS